MEPHGLHDGELGDLIQYDNRQTQQTEQQITDGVAQRTASTQRSQRVGWSEDVPTDLR